MVMVDVHEAETDLSRLLQQVEDGEEVVICREGVPVARLIQSEAPAEAPPKRLTWGRDVGKFVVPADFNAPLGREFGQLDGAWNLPSSFDEPLPEDVLEAIESELR